jgi:ribonuclease VapC
MTKKRFADPKKIEILGRIHQLAFKILPVPNTLVYQAAEIKAEYPISYADSFAVACAIEHGATIVTGDPEFKHVEHLVKIEWIR